MRPVDEVGADLDGLSQLRALIASGRKAGILEALDFDFIEVEAGRAVFAGTPGDHAYNPIGSVHGGYAATLLDSSCGCAAHSRLTASQAFTTLELKVGVYKTLKKDGYTITVVQNPTISLADDVAVTKRAIAGQSGPVILVGHSYGGVVIKEAGNDPKVAGLVYVTAFAPDKGE